ncbi:unnamed protein product [Bursaphelenchus okinawaensis]|uniref:Calpain catalytic domain-containing protein n=1 Tax=Bursaphelenchus okinawaensis TaxID=465554 RepID=A0A811LSI0_9BILA|nr:unnamed protein product [Bursaphelenchus okinawaensis]CAG9127705.1 unnamed protein product [Bursaphelenchus okinawaensis]
MLTNFLVNSWLKAGDVPGEQGNECPRTASPTASFTESDPKNTKSDKRERLQNCVTTAFGITVGPRPTPNSCHYKINVGGKLFEDPDFEMSSLKDRFPKLEFKRPPEICQDPKFFIKGRSSKPSGKSQIGDAWFLPAVTLVASRPDLIEKVFDVNQSFEKEKYTGMFKFKFWLYGEWVNIVVDDRLPVNGKNLMFCGVNDEGFWMALLEKAYAKLIGSYDAITCVGYPFSLLCLTGGIIDTVHKSEFEADEYEKLAQETATGVLILALTSYDLPLGGINGLLPNQAHALTGLIEVKTSNNTTIQLVKLCSPWNTVKWTGKWCGSKTTWAEINASDKERLIKEKTENEYWMDWTEFVKLFERLSKCYVTPNALIECVEKVPPTQKESTSIPVQHHWRRKTSGGAPGTDRNRFQRNPQFVVNVSYMNEGEKGKIPVIYNLLLKYGEKTSRRCIASGIVVYKMPDEESGRFRRFDANFFNDPTNQPVYTQKVFKYCGSAGYLKLDPGAYVFVASSFVPEDHGTFFLRIVAQGKLLVSLASQCDSTISFLFASTTRDY